MNDPWLLFTTALQISLVVSPFAVVALTFLHAAQIPQWVWAFSDRTQIIWLASLLLGVALLPLGLVATIRYWWRVRPQLASIERGEMDWGGHSKRKDT